MSRPALASIAALIVLVSVVAYLPVRHAGFIQDDHPIVELNPVVHDGDLLRVFGTDWWEGVGGSDRFLYRPITIASFVLERGPDGRVDPGTAHAINVLLHALCAALTGLLTWRLGRSRAVAATAALLFAAHPVHVSAVAGLVGRAEILALLFTLAAMIALARRAGAGGAVAPVRYAWTAAVCAALAMLSKESGFAAPAVLGVVAWLDASGTGRKRLLSAWRAWWPTLVAAIVVLGLRTAVLGAVVSVQVPRLSDNPLVGLDGAERWWTTLAVAGRYAVLLLWPWTLSADYSGNVVAAEPSPFAPLPIAGALFLGVLVALAVRGTLGPGAGAAVRSERRVVTVAAWLFLVPYAVVGNVVVLIGVVMAERLIYPASAGICILLAAAAVHAVRATASRFSWSAPVTAVVLAFAVAVPVAAGTWRTHVEARNWRNEETLFEAVAEATPNNPRAQFTIGMIRLEQGEPERAMARFERTVELWPDFSAAWFEMGRLHAAAGRYDDAERAFARAIEINPYHDRARRMHGQALHRLGRLDEAAERLADTLERVPSDPATLAEYGHVLVKLGRYEAAADAYRRAIALGRDDLAANLALAEREAARAR